MRPDLFTEFRLLSSLHHRRAEAIDDAGEYIEDSVYVGVGRISTEAQSDGALGLFDGLSHGE